MRSRSPAPHAPRLPPRALPVLLLSACLVARGAAGAACTGDCDGDGQVQVAELVRGVAASLGEPSATSCVAFDRNGDGRVTVDELVAAVANALLGCPVTPVPFSAALDAGEPALVLTPVHALEGERVYALVLTTGIRDASGRALQASPAFRARLGIGGTGADGPVALFDEDPEANGNPYPDERLVADGIVHIPDRVALRGLPDTPPLATARAVLRETADQVGAAGLFSTTAPIRIPLSAPIDLATVTPETVRFFARRDGGTHLAPVLGELARMGVPAAAVALVVSVPTQAVEADLLAARARLDERAWAGTLRAVLADPQPDDDLVLGVFHRGGTDMAAFFAANPAVDTVAHGLIPAPELRGYDGLFVAERLEGTAPAPDVALDFYLTLPAGPGPHRAVVVQHGFGGDNRMVLSVANELAAAGLAGIGISAVAHGRRGSPLELLSSTPLQLRDILRQTVADQLALVRAIAAGIDTDGDGASDLEADGIDYLGVSLGGIVGAVLIAIEPGARAAVLNVAGGRVAFLGDNPGTRPIYTQYLATRAELALGSPEFEVFLQRMLALGQQALDPADPLDFARRWRLDPFPGFAPRRVLMQEGIGDLLVSNASTEALAAAGGLDADEPMADPGGVSGLWRFSPPEGHGIFGRADVRAQAVHFLASGGTEIIDPGAP